MNFSSHNDGYDLLSHSLQSLQIQPQSQPQRFATRGDSSATSRKVTEYQAMNPRKFFNSINSTRAWGKILGTDDALLNYEYNHLYPEGPSTQHQTRGGFEMETPAFSTMKIAINVSHPTFVSAHNLQNVDPYWLDKNDGHEVWPVTYHGVKEAQLAKDIINTGYRSIQNPELLGAPVGVASTNKIENAIKHATIVSVRGLDFYVVTMNRVHPQTYECSLQYNNSTSRRGTCADGEYNFIDRAEEGTPVHRIRPYAILLIPVKAYNGMANDGSMPAFNNNSRNPSMWALNNTPHKSSQQLHGYTNNYAASNVSGTQYSNRAQSNIGSGTGSVASQGSSTRVGSDQTMNQTVVQDDDDGIGSSVSHSSARSDFSRILHQQLGSANNAPSHVSSHSSRQSQQPSANKPPSHVSSHSSRRNQQGSSQSDNGSTHSSHRTSQASSLSSLADSGSLASTVNLGNCNNPSTYFGFLPNNHAIFQPTMGSVPEYHQQ